MRSLESLIRPFQAPVVVISRRVVADGEKDPEETSTLAWGVAGNIAGAIEEETAPEEGAFNFKVIDCDDQYSELRRDETALRVENPDDSDNYVMFARINKIQFDKKTKEDGNFPYLKTTTAYAGEAFENVNFTTTDWSNKQCVQSYKLTPPA